MNKFSSLTFDSIDLIITPIMERVFVLNNFDFENIYDLEVDSPSTIYALMKLMEKRGYKTAKRFEHTNLYQFMKDHVEETTSHQFFGFFLKPTDRGLFLFCQPTLIGDYP